MYGGKLCHRDLNAFTFGAWSLMMRDHVKNKLQLQQKDTWKKKWCETTSFYPYQWFFWSLGIAVTTTLWQWDQNENYQFLPISLAFVGTSLRSRLTILMASNRISMMLFRRANNGAKGKAATKIVVKLNWITGKGRKGQWKNQICVCFKENKSFVIKDFMQISATMLGYCVWLPSG